MSSVDERLYQIACSFVALKRKGLESGDIPGIGPQAFYDQTLADFIYHGPGGCWCSSEILLLEFLLNLYNPTLYPQFNLGEALYVMDPAHMKALLNAMSAFTAAHEIEATATVVKSGTSACSGCSPPKNVTGFRCLLSSAMH